MLGDGPVADGPVADFAPVEPAVAPAAIAQQLQDLHAELATATEWKPYQLWHRWHLVLEHAARALGGRPQEDETIGERRLIRLEQLAPGARGVQRRRAMETLAKEDRVDLDVIRRSIARAEEARRKRSGQ